MNLAVVRRRAAMRSVALDRSLEPLPLFRLSDSADDAQVTYTTDDGGRWRVLPAPGDRLPGTFDQDVYVELCRRFHDAEHPRKEEAPRQRGPEFSIFGKGDRHGCLGA